MADWQDRNSSGAGAPPLETGPQILQRLGIDAEKWCAEMVKVGAVIADPAPGGQFHAWMCNAIMYAGDTGYGQAKQEARAEAGIRAARASEAANRIINRWGLAAAKGLKPEPNDDAFIVAVALLRPERDASGENAGIAQAAVISSEHIPSPPQEKENG